MNIQDKIVLISEPCALDNPSPYLPYQWAILKSYWERHGDNHGVKWLDPIFLNDAAANLLQPYDGISIDLLGLSCYTWNWILQCSIARQVKTHTPDCLVVAGGPEPDYKDPDFFRRHPYIDIVVVKDGEIAFNHILSKLINDERDFRDIAGLYLPGKNGGGHIYTGPADLPKKFDHSPYIDQSSYFEKIIEHYDYHFFAVWETNRGCPYSCNFCDWGSNTMSKLRRFDMQKVEAEIAWFGRMKIGLVYLVDANFGILPRDIDIADRINDVRKKSGYPKYLMYTAAKNNPERSVTIAKSLAETDICPVHGLSIQHTHEDVLKAVDRQNISPQKQVAVVKELLQNDIPIETHLIGGIPGDTYTRWKSCFADLMEWGIHDEYLVFIYNLLPNAPSSQKGFLDQWEVETIDRIVFSSPCAPRKKGDLDFVRMTKSRVVIKSKTYTREDWVRMFTYSAFIKALHNCSITRLISIYLRLTHHVSYLDFYQHLLEDFFTQTPFVRDWYQGVLNHYKCFLENDEATDHIEVKQLPQLPYTLDPSRWVFVQICMHLDQFFDRLEFSLLARYPNVLLLKSIIHYQKNLIILPTYNRDIGKSFRVDFDWINYFDKARIETGTESMEEPRYIPNAQVDISDTSCGESSYVVHPLDWGTGSAEDQWIQWVTHVALHRNSAAKSNFQRTALRTDLTTPGEFRGRTTPSF